MLDKTAYKSYNRIEYKNFVGGEGMGSSTPKIKATVGGLRPIEQYFLPIGSSLSGEIIAARSSFRMNSDKNGVIFGRDYFPVLEKYPDRAAEFVSLILCQLSDTLENFSERDISLNFISIPLTVSLLKRQGFCPAILEEVSELHLDSSKLCFELPDTIYNESDGAAADAIAELRRENFLFMINSYGGSAATTYRLADIPVDYVLLAGALTKLAAAGERQAIAVKSSVRLANELDTEVIATEVSNDAEGAAVAEAGCTYCTGQFIGSEVNRQYFRQSKK